MLNDQKKNNGTPFSGLAQRLKKTLAPKPKSGKKSGQKPAQKRQPEQRDEQRTEQRQQPERKQKPAKKGMSREKERLLMVVMIVVAVFMLLLMTAVLIWTRLAQRPEPDPSDPPSASLPVSPSPPGPQDSPGVTPTPGGTDLEAVQPKVGGQRKSEDFYTILVFGCDTATGLTDTIMLISYDVTNQKATVMSIPRDTLVNVRTEYKVINGVYTAGGQGAKGISRLRNEVAELVGFTPDYYVMINWELVGMMVEAIEGVWFDVPYHMDYDDPLQDLHIHLDPGPQQLDGEKAMQLVRWRKNNLDSPYYGEGGGSDAGRVNLQQEFLKTVLEQVLRLKNAARIGQLAQFFGENVETNLTVPNILWFATKAVLGGLKVDDVSFITMPHYNVGRVYSNYYGRVYPNWDQLLKLSNKSLNPFKEDVTLKQMDLIRVNDDDTLTSSTGTLADPNAAIPPEPRTEPISEDERDADPFAPPPVQPIEPVEPTPEPVQPSTEPVQPGTEPEQPGTEPEQPGTEPEQPGTEPDQPVIGPDQPAGPDNGGGTEPPPGGTEEEQPPAVT